MKQLAGWFNSSEIIVETCKYKQQPELNVDVNVEWLLEADTGYLQTA